MHQLRIPISVPGALCVVAVKDAHVDTLANGHGSFGDALRRRRSELGLTQEELAARTGLSVRTISDIERGRTPRPRRSSTSLLARVLGVDESMLADCASAPPGNLAEVDHAPVQVVPRQLPIMSSQFVGRAAEIEDLNELLAQLEAGGQPAAVAAISGTAGVGKTALAIRWAHQVADRFPDGQLYLDLRGFGPASPVEQAEAMCGFLEALGVLPARIPVQAEARVGLYRSLLASRRMLVLLDNASDADHVLSLLPGSPGSLALVTSRNPLTGLAVAHGARSVSLDVLTAGDARGLLVARLGAERVSCEPAAADALVELTAGLPLALSIAAARATAHPKFPLAALAAEAPGCARSAGSPGGRWPVGRRPRRHLLVLPAPQRASGVDVPAAWHPSWTRYDGRGSRQPQRCDEDRDPAGAR